MSDYRKQVLTILLRALGVLVGLALIIALTGCSAYSAYPTSTPQPATPKPGLTATPVTGLVQVTGNVYVRDDNNEVQGWLEAGTLVQAECEGNWCYIKGGQFKGLRFWRGCSEDNPDDMGCTAAG
jgi:hypothetical protein